MKLYTLSPISRDASESHTSLLYLLNQCFESLQPLFLKDITIPEFLWRQVFPRSTLRNIDERLHKLIVPRLAETESSPKCTEGVQFMQGAFSYRVSGN
jgi:hypothetical protein